MLRAPNGSKRQGLIAPQSAAAELAVLDRAGQELAHCDCLETVKSFRDRAEAFHHFAQSAKKGLELVNKVAEIKIRAERRAGQLLADMDLRGGDRVSDSHRQRVTLKQLNISQSQSARWQKAAEVPEEEFRKLIEVVHAHEVELTTAALMRLATALRKKRDLDHRGGGASRKDRSSTRRRADSSPEEIIAELQNHCATFDGILSPVYDAVGPVDLPDGDKRYLRRLVGEFKSLLDELKELSSSRESGART